MATCADEYDPHSLTVEQAKERILAAISPLTLKERLPVRDALDRIIAVDIQAPFDIPSAANSAMDGYAFCESDARADQPELVLAGRSYAGQPYGQQLKKGECVRITTGALVPDGADTVVMQEYVQVSQDRVTIQQVPAKGSNIRGAGEDLRAGTTALTKGKRLNSADIGLLASMGFAEIDVVRQPIISFFSTGDELCSVGETLEPGQLYDSNRYTLHSLLRRTGANILDLGVVRDDYDSVCMALRDAAARSDMVITSGGVSVGDADFVKDALSSLGQIDFWKIAVKPGRPLAFGNIGDSLFLGLPGNPVSVIATFILFVRPAIARLSGEFESPELLLQATCLSPLRKAKGRTDFQRGLLAYSPDQGLTVETTGLQGSHVLSSMSRANCFIVLPRNGGDVAPGETVKVMPFPGIV